MQVNLTIGEFSRMTHLSVKTLRHYHRIGLLAPALVDRHSGYRYYTTAQVPAAQIIRRFRNLDMPVEHLRAVLAAPDPQSRNALILAHLANLEAQLQQTQDAVAALRDLLSDAAGPVAVGYRSVPPTPVIAVAETVTGDDLLSWFDDTFRALHAQVRAKGLRQTGPAGAMYDTALFEQERGEATIFVPVADPPSGTGRIQPMVLPAAELAIAVHRGSHADVDRTYGALGTHVAEHELGVDAPIREHYLVYRLDTVDAARWRTEIAWPIFRTEATK